MHKLLGLIILLFAFNCKSTENQTKMTKEDIVLIGKGNLYGAGSEGIRKQNLVISTLEAWKDLLNKMNAVNKVSESFLETDIDFSKYTVIAVFNEVKNTGGHSIELNFQKTSDKILVVVVHKSPKDMATTVMTQPYYIVKILKSDLPIVFE